MRTILKTVCLLLSSLFFCCAYASGGITHMFIAQEVIARLPDPQLRQLLQDNLEIYLVGAYYPDSGYIDGAHYGEDSHWDPFIYAFADYLKEEYPQPEQSNPKLVAFLFGCAAHRVSDEITHWTFYNEIAREDFKGNQGQAHSYGDFGIDILIHQERSEGLVRPTTWWIPVSDLLRVYHRMGKDQYTKKEIEWGTSVLYTSGYGERSVSLPSYYYLKWKMPWTAAHYYDWPVGGILKNEEKVAEYQMNLWYRLKGIAAAPAQMHKDVYPGIANNAIQPRSNAINVNVKSNTDGSIELHKG